MDREEAIRRVRAWNLDADDIEVLSVLIPELKENEGEKIRKWLIGYFKQYTIDGMPQVFGNGLNVKDVITWLEKKGECKPTIIIPRFRVGDKIEQRHPKLGKIIYTIVDFEKGNYLVDGGNTPLCSIGIDYIDNNFTLMEPNSLGWNKEDEKIYSRIYDLIHAAAFENYDVDEDGKELGEYAKITNWFKSLKERVGNFDDGYKVGFSAAKHNQWKPSDGQIGALGKIKLGGYIDGKLYDATYSLYKDLKKLKEE